jgi:hypothetical protein
VVSPVPLVTDQSVSAQPWLGVGIYEKSNLKFKLLPQCSGFVDCIFETLFIEITTPNSEKLIFGSVYRPGKKHPNLSASDQLTQFNELLNLTSVMNYLCLIPLSTLLAILILMFLNIANST